MSKTRDQLLLGPRCLLHMLSPIKIQLQKLKLCGDILIYVMIVNHFKCTNHGLPYRTITPNMEYTVLNRYAASYHTKLRTDTVIEWYQYGVQY